MSRCCNHNCEQGRACPYRSHKPLSLTQELIILGVSIALAVGVLWLL